MATNPIYPDLPSSDSDLYVTPTAPVFFDEAQVQTHNYNKHRNSETKFTEVPMRQKNDDDEQNHIFDANREPNSPADDSNGVVRVIDENEHLTVR